VGKWAIGLYLGRTAVASPYGAAGSVIVIVLWVYYASLILLFGAEFTRVYSRHFLGSRRVASPGAHRVRRVREEVGETR
jgi:membrane protein